MYGKITTKENHLDHPLINLIEIKLEERFRSIHDTFRTFDENGDSRLSYSEFEKGMIHLTADLTREDIKTVFDMLDSNKDGFIEYHEFCDSFDSYKRRGNPLVTSQQTKDLCAGTMKLHELDKMIHKDSGVKYTPPSMFGVVNDGVSNSFKNRLHKFRNSDNISGFGSKTSRRFNFGNDTQDEKSSTMDEILSQASAMRTKMNLPDAKSKNVQKFMNDVSESGK